MDFNIKSGSPEKQRTACVIVGVFESRRLSDAAKAIDDASDKHLSNLIRRGDMEGNRGQYLLLHNVPGMIADRVLLIGCGKEREINGPHRLFCSRAPQLIEQISVYNDSCRGHTSNPRGYFI